MTSSLSFPNIFLPYTRIIDHEEEPHADKLAYEEEILNLSGISADTLTIQAVIAEIKNIKVREINVIGTLYLHDCSKPIESVRASGDIYLYRCQKVKYVSAQGNVFITYHPQEFPECDYGRISSGKNIIKRHIVINEPSICFVVNNCSVGEAVRVDEYHKYVFIFGDCSKIKNIVFEGNKYSSNERLVFVGEGASFKGEVDGGHLLFMHELNEDEKILAKQIQSQLEPKGES